MPESLPIACTLTATELPQRLADLGRTADAPEGAEPVVSELVVLLGGGVLMVLCCAVGPAVIGAVAGSAVGGWLGIACAVLVAGAAALLVHRRRGREGR